MFGILRVTCTIKWNQKPLNTHTHTKKQLNQTIKSHVIYYDKNEPVNNIILSPGASSYYYIDNSLYSYIYMYKYVCSDKRCKNIYQMVPFIELLSLTIRFQRKFFPSILAIPFQSKAINHRCVSFQSICLLVCCVYCAGC